MTVAAAAAIAVAGRTMELGRGVNRWQRAISSRQMATVALVRPALRLARPSAGRLPWTGPAIARSSANRGNM